MAGAPLTCGEQDMVTDEEKLKKAGQNQLAQTVEKGSAGQGQTGGPSTAAPGAAPHVAITNQSGKVQAPVISNATFTQNCNMTFN
ncbi:hypothetical protein SKAU_G00295330 [Synaphobranchus kaupii]|uniref:Uncharacterized protein n=1 Tax=Synaphobranchus kaupii TaxID=118154 RepID=A0A9Q1IKK7_SYNKA|nr:hypothetical protein SKAU_G00295330 [Synaphobranchus kaupii]